jgi:hypothetical protein
MAEHLSPDAAGFRDLASRKRTHVVLELWNFARDTRKWWLLPLLLVIMAIGAIIVLGGSAAAPFIYTLF